MVSAAKSDPTPTLPCKQGREQKLRVWFPVRAEAARVIPPPAQQGEGRRGRF